MKAFSCFVIVCGVLVSSDLAFGFSVGVRQLESEDKSDGKVAPAEETNPEALKKVQGRVALLKQALIRDINNQESSETALIQTLRNSTSKQLKKPDIYSDETAVPTQVSNSLEDSQGSYSKGEALVTNYWQPAARDLSKDTLINDRISQQQASAGIVKIDPDAEFIDPSKHKGHIAQDTRSSFKYDRRPIAPGADRDVEEIEGGNHNVVDQSSASDLSSDIRVNEHMFRQLERGIFKPDPDSEFIDPSPYRKHVAQKPKVNFRPNEVSGILSRFGNDRDAGTDSTNNFEQSLAGADLTKDILVNEHAANQVSSGLVTADPDSEFISLDRPNKMNKNYYYVPNTAQQAPAEDLTRDTSISFESLVDQPAPMIEPYPQYTNDRRYTVPSQNSYLRNADRFQRTPHGDLSGDTVINDHISQQQSAQGLVMIDPDAELINTDANQHNNIYYYYVPNNIDQVPRMKRTEPVYTFYQRPVVRYQYPQPQQPFLYYY